jgi:divalent metal cation (Fe/Co/Zn/Cd) transporter
VALISDAAHSFSDIISDVVTLVAVKVARRPSKKSIQFRMSPFTKCSGQKASLWMGQVGICRCFVCWMFIG